MDSAPGAWLTTAEEWFRDHRLGGDGHDHVPAWERLRQQAHTVVTLFGTYDSGKSSVLRRLLVDVGVVCPEWLTISARHETFEVGSITLNGLVMQDSPGLSPAADDARGLHNNEQALAAVRLTDAVVVVLPPQLATAELSDLRALVAEAWPPGALICVISRFDEAGVNPAGDPDAYRTLAERKVVEARAALGLADDVPVHVVAPDPYQLAGSDRQPNPEIWDDYRSWDGMAALASALRALEGSTPELRLATGVRYWTSVIHAELARVDAELRKVQAAQDAAQQSLARQQHLSHRLDELRSAAQAELEGSLTRVLDLSLQSGLEDTGRLADRITRAVESWLEAHALRLQTIVQDIDGELDRQMKRPTWQSLEQDLDGLRAEREAVSLSVEEDAPGSASWSSRLIKVNTSLANSVEELRKVYSKRTSDFSEKARTARAASSASPGAAPTPQSRLVGTGEVVVALSPTVIEVVTLFQEWHAERAMQGQQREALERIEAKFAELQDKIAKEAWDAFQEGLDAAGSAVGGAAHAVEEFAAALEVRKALLNDSEHGGRELLRGAPFVGTTR